ncbi:hypothetical protein ACFX13_005744 [Malus domestica]
MKMEKGKEIITDDSNTLYLCFCENMLDGTIAYALHAIALSHVLRDPWPRLGSSTSFLAAGLRQGGYARGKDLPHRNRSMPSGLIPLSIPNPES